MAANHDTHVVSGIQYHEHLAEADANTACRRSLSSSFSMHDPSNSRSGADSCPEDQSSDLEAIADIAVPPVTFGDDSSDSIGSGNGPYDTSSDDNEDQLERVAADLICSPCHLVVCHNTFRPAYTLLGVRISRCMTRQVRNRTT